jgi:hypothetical protein
MLRGTVASRRCWYMCVVGRFVGSPCCVSPFKSWHVSLPAAIQTLWLHYVLSFLRSQQTVLQLVKKYPAFYGTRRFITVLTTATVLSQMNPEIFAVLWCYATYIGSYLLTFRDDLSLPYSRVRHLGASVARVSNSISDRHVLWGPVTAHTIPYVTAHLNGQVDPWRYVR